MEHETRMALQALTNEIATLTMVLERVSEAISKANSAWQVKPLPVLHWEPSAGDVVKIIVSDYPFYSVGAIGKIVRLDNEKYEIDFNGFGNPSGSYNESNGGRWWTGRASIVKHKVAA